MGKGIARFSGDLGPTLADLIYRTGLRFAAALIGPDRNDSSKDMSTVARHGATAFGVNELSVTVEMFGPMFKRAIRVE